MQLSHLTMERRRPFICLLSGSIEVVGFIFAVDELGESKSRECDPLPVC